MFKKLGWVLGWVMFLNFSALAQDEFHQMNRQQGDVVAPKEAPPEPRWPEREVRPEPKPEAKPRKVQLNTEWSYCMALIYLRQDAFFANDPERIQGASDLFQRDCAPPSALKSAQKAIDRFESRDLIQ